MEEPTDWVLFWLSAHNVLGIAIDRAFGSGSKRGTPNVDKAEGDAEDDNVEDMHESDNDDDIPLPEFDIGMPDPAKEESTLQRQSTYRSNSVLWLASSPEAQLWCFRSVLRVQQDGQRLPIKYAPPSAKVTELENRRKGNLPTYPVVMAVERFFAKDAMKDFGILMSTETSWNRIPSEHQIHSLSLSCSPSSRFAGLLLLSA